MKSPRTRKRKPSPRRPLARRSPAARDERNLTPHSRIDADWVSLADGDYFENAREDGRRAAIQIAAEALFGAAEGAREAWLQFRQRFQKEIS